MNKPIPEDPLLAEMRQMRVAFEKMATENAQLRSEKEKAETAQRDLDKNVEQIHRAKINALPKGKTTVVWPATLHNQPITCNSVRVGPFAGGQVVEVPIWVPDMIKNYEADLAYANARMAALAANPCLGVFNS